MDRVVFNVLSTLLGLLYILIVVGLWGSITGALEGSVGDGANAVAGAITGFILLIGIILQSRIADVVTTSKAPEVAKTSDDEKLAHVESIAAKALKEGRPRHAIQAYEGAGLYMKALELARETGDKAAMARLFMRLGKHERALKYYHEAGDFETAGHISCLLGKFDEARSYYREAAEKGAGNLSPGALAGLWDRAGNRARALELYEEAGEMRAAAECALLSGDRERHKVLEDRAAVLEAYERRKGSAAADDTKHRQEMAKAAELCESMGDLFGAADAYRKAADHKRAAALFEKIGELERAAEAYAKAGDAQRAATLKAQAAAAGAPSAAPLGPPPPTMPPTEPPLQEPAPQFAPLPPPAPMAAPQPPPAQPSPAPVVYVAGPAQAPTAPPPAFPKPTIVPVTVFNPASALPAASMPIFVAQAATYLGSAAPTTTTSSPAAWLNAAMTAEQAGNTIAAAELYRQMGRFEKSLTCLEAASRPKDAALMAFAVGQRQQALDMLRKRVESSRDEGLGLLLGEMLVERGKHFQALALLRRTLAPQGCNEENASLYFRFARRFEELGAEREAMELYDEMLEAGAQSTEVSERLAVLETKLGIPRDHPERQAVRRSRAKPLEKKSVSDMLRHSIEDTTSRHGQIPLPPTDSPAAAESAPPPPPVKPFPFAPPARPAGLSRVVPMLSKGAPLVVQELSLFGAPGVVAEASDATAPTLPRLAPPPDPFSPAMRYRLIRELARGGMGVVYEGYDQALQRPVAIKLISNQDADPDDIEQFLLEARAIARLSHQNVVAVYDVGLMNLKHYLAMELVTGEDLKVVVEREKRLPLKEALRIFVELARGLQVAHEAGVVHRDIKPANVLMSLKRQVKIVDFGLAKLCRGTLREAGERTIFKTAGTPGYMAPEQIAGGEIGPAADIYALGIVLFTMLVGAPPHRVAGVKGTGDILDFQTKGELPSLAEHVDGLPAPFEQVYRYCTAVDVGQRYRSIDAFLPIVEQWAAVL